MTGRTCVETGSCEDLMCVLGTEPVSSGNAACVLELSPPILQVRMQL